LQSALQFLRQENSRIQLRRDVTSDTWLNDPLLTPSKADTPQAMIEGRRMALISDFRKFVTGCQIIDVKITEIGGKGWKSNKLTPGYVLRRQQEMYQRLRVRKLDLLEDLKGLAIA
jgi:hypothetical protein